MWGKKSGVAQLQNGIAALLDVPQKAVGGGVFVEISSNTEIIIGGCGGILEYTDSLIRVSAGNMILKLCGRGLQIVTLSPTTLSISGTILSLHYVK